MPTLQTRRRFMTALSSAGAAGLLRAPPLQAAEETPETTTVRLTKVPGICLAPQYVAEELLRVEGFTDIRYVDVPAGVLPLGKVDFSQAYAANFLKQIEPATRLPCCRGYMSAASNCSQTKPFTEFTISRARPSACRPWDRSATRSC